MPSGAVHFKFWKFGWIPTIGATTYLFYLNHPVEACGVMLGYGLGALIDPDLDIMGTSNAESRMVNKIPVAGHLFYGSIFRKHHRSFWTHTPIVSTAIRILFFFWWIGIFYWKGWIIYEDWHLVLFLGIFAGLSFADFLHWFADSLPKRLTRRR